MTYSPPGSGRDENLPTDKTLNKGYADFSKNNILY
jgi:hypothetical protein